MAFTNSMKLTMVADSFYIPKDNPDKPRGEDAHFFCPEAQVIGVADGVGGWAKKGIDAGEYARELMRNAAAAVKASGATGLDPKHVLMEAFVKTSAEGSSTACIMSLDGNRLRAANLGDSGFMVIRRGKTLYKCQVQQYGFNIPYQLGKAWMNTPDEAEEVVVELECGDIVVAGTDGLFDNMFPKDIEETVERCLEEGMRPETVACELARTACLKSLEGDTVSPFEAEAYQAGVEYFGGKYDDITVVVAYVVPQSLHHS